MNRFLLLLLALVLVGTTTVLSQGKISGLMFGDYYYNVARDASFGGTAPSNAAISGASAGPTAMQAFQFRRIYFTYDNDLADQFTTRFRLEADQGFTTSPTTGDALGSGKMSVFVKDAYLKWKGLFSGSDLIFGVQPTAAYDVSEGFWGYRSLEKTIMDLRGIVPSRDLGVGLKGKLVGDGMLNYWVLVGNDAGNVPESNKFKRYEGQLQLKPTSNLIATVYVDYKDVADVANSYTKALVTNTAMTAAVFIGYTQPGQFSVGVEGFLQSTQNAFKDTVAKSYDNRSAMGISVFGNYSFTSDLALVARFDMFDPSTDSGTKDPVNVTAATAAGNVARNYVIVGLDYKAAKNVSIIPNVLYEGYSVPTNAAGVDNSITARVTFAYTFQ
jgi:hypothetical protein